MHCLIRCVAWMLHRSTHTYALHSHACQPCRGLRILFGDQTLFCRADDFRHVCLLLSIFSLWAMNWQLSSKPLVRPALHAPSSWPASSACTTLQASTALIRSCGSPALCSAAQACGRLRQPAADHGGCRPVPAAAHGGWVAARRRTACLLNVVRAQWQVVSQVLPGSAMTLFPCCPTQAQPASRSDGAASSRSVPLPTTPAGGGWPAGGNYMPQVRLGCGWAGGVHAPCALLASQFISAAMCCAHALPGCPHVHSCSSCFLLQLCMPSLGSAGTWAPARSSWWRCTNGCTLTSTVEARTALPLLCVC